MASTGKNSDCIALSCLSQSTTVVAFGNDAEPASQAQITSIAPDDPALSDLPWYRQWVVQQVRDQPQRILSSLPHINLDKNNEPDLTDFFRVWNRIRELVLILPTAARTIDNIAHRLVLDGHITVDSSYDADHSVKELVFSILGWQTMLYKPDLYKTTVLSNDITGYGLLSGRGRGAGGTSGSGGGYSIVDETDGYTGCETRLCLTQHTSAAGSKRLPEFLLGFGMLLPPPNYCATLCDTACDVDGDDQSQTQLLFRQTRTISVKHVNAHMLTKVCGLTIQWVDSLSCHLELDPQTGRLFMYRYPSFCLSNLRQNLSSQLPVSKLGRQPLSNLNDDGIATRGHRSGTVLQACALEKPEGPSSIPWATQDDVNAILREVILSYRLIFGQCKKSRSVFRNLSPFPPTPNTPLRAAKTQDYQLMQLCGRKRFDFGTLHQDEDSYGSPADLLATLVEREEYDLPGDFPHLRGRFVRLNQYAAGKKPRSVRQLWGDRRDSTAWLALWSVLIFGSLSILLALVQTIFQILEFVSGQDS